MSAVAVEDRIDGFTVRHDHEWATVLMKFGANEDRGWGTLLVNSSFGVYGHHWTHIGPRSLPEFLAEIGTDYLLSKISHKEGHGDKMLYAIRERVDVLHSQGEISIDQWQEAVDEIEAIECEGGGCEVMAMRFLESAAMPNQMDYCELSYFDYPQQATAFIQKLWPSIVEKLKAM